MRKIYFFFISFFFFASSFAQTVVVTGADAATLAGNPYSTLKAAFDNINLSSQAGNVIVITITGVTTETASASLNQSAGAWTSLTIIPAGASQITGNIAGHLVNLNGADNVTIDGLSTAGNSLAINNSNSGNASSTIRFINDASNNLINKVNILGSAGNALGAGFGVVFFSTGTVTGNDNNTINQCSISASSNGTPLNGIYSLGASALIDNSNNSITTNNINNYFSAGSASNGMNINSGNSGWTITSNALYQTATRIASTGSTHNGIFITSGSGYNISNNVIGFAAPNATGTTNYVGLTSGSLGGSFPSAFTPGGVANATRFVGINCTFTAGGASASIQNNTIGGIAIYATGVSTTLGTLCGISVQGGNANIGTITGNTIGSTSAAGALYAANTVAGGVISGIYCTTTNTITIQNNNIGGIDVSGTTATTAAGFKGIEVAGTGTYTVSNNNVGNATPDNIRTGYLLTGANLSNAATTPTAASGVSAIQGIVSSSSGSTLLIANNLVHGIRVSGTATTFNGITNTGAVTTTININNNQLGNALGGVVTFSSTTSGEINCINNSAGDPGATLNINSNSFDGIAVLTSGTVRAILNTASIGVAININNNLIGSTTGTFVTFNGIQSNSVLGIYNNASTVNAAVSIKYNDIRGFVHAVNGFCQEQFIYTSAAAATTLIDNNTFTNMNINNWGDVTLIKKFGDMASGASTTISNNSIVGTFTRITAGGSLTMYSGNSLSVTGSTVSITGNNFSNITVSGIGNFVGFYVGDAAGIANAPSITISGNIFNNIITNFGMAGIFVGAGLGVTVTSNVISNISGASNINGILLGSSVGTANCNIASNTISNLSSTSNVRGIESDTGNPPVMNINSNTITGLSSAEFYNEGVTCTNGQVINIYDNTINTFTITGATSPSLNGISISGGQTINIYRNKIYNLLLSAAITIASPVVNGLLLSSGTTITAYNNFISDIKATNANDADAIRGINITGTTASTTYNLYYNSIYINAASTGTNFGTSGIYHTTSATATTGKLNMIDNIIVNTSTANGTGVTAAYRRSSTTLTNYASTSNYNDFYAGTPGPKNLIFYDGTNSDQTLAAYKARVSPRDANSISLMPVFTSATDLHLTPNNCALDNKGTPIAGITNDIDLDTRSTTVPDIGADEFDAYNTGVLAGVAGTAVCSNKAVVNTGTIYTDASCNLIAKVLPSGGAPVTGIINTCVTRDATQLYFNGDPYVQRHYDIEPVTSNQTTTSATITLYFTDAEFALYNTNNPARPPLPTIANNTVATRNNVKVTQFHGTPTGGLPTSTPGNYGGAFALIIPGAANVVLNGSVWAVSFDITGFSGFYVHTNNFNAPLPVVVNYLTGHRQGSNHLLNWKVTCASTPRATMTLERSADARNYTGINTITADAARCSQPFDHTDANPLNGMNYYRLKIVDADGKITYSTTVALLNAVKGFDIISIAPNPVVTDNFKLNIASAQAGKMDIAIFDMQGRLVNRQSISVIAGYNSATVNVVNLSAGTYTIKGSMSDDQSKVMRFVKQ